MTPAELTVEDAAIEFAETISQLDALLAASVRNGLPREEQTLLANQMIRSCHAQSEKWRKALAAGKHR